MPRPNIPTAMHPTAIRVLEAAHRIATPPEPLGCDRLGAELRMPPSSVRRWKADLARAGLWHWATPKPSAGGKHKPSAWVAHEAERERILAERFGRRRPDDGKGPPDAETAMKLLIAESNRAVRRLGLRLGTAASPHNDKT